MGSYEITQSQAATMYASAMRAWHASHALAKAEQQIRLSAERGDTSGKAVWDMVAELLRNAPKLQTAPGASDHPVRTQ